MTSKTGIATLACMNKSTVFVTLAVIFLVASYFISRAVRKNRTVVIYVSHDQDYSQPVLDAFEKETGITVKAVYDTEASKTVGLTNRLIAEKGNPQADVFWNNEVTRTIQLKREGVLEPYIPQRSNRIDPIHKDAEGYWTGFAARARVLVVNKNLVAEPNVSQSLESLTNIQFKNKVTIADPRFGTTGPHLAALYTIWGEEKFTTYLQHMKNNGIYIAQSNGNTRDMVVSGEMMVGFTDTDDANDAISEGKPVRMIYPDQDEGAIGTLIIPNTIMLIAGTKHKTEAMQLIDYIISPETESKLAHGKSAQMPLLSDVDVPDNVPAIETIRAMAVSWEDVYTNLPKVLDIAESVLLQ